MGSVVFNIFTTVSIICMVIFCITFLYFLIRMLKKPRLSKKAIIVLVCSGGLSLTYLTNYYNNLNFLPIGILNYSFASPNGDYEVRTYHYDGIFAQNARAELIDIKQNKKDTIYFNDYDYSPAVTWIDNQQFKVGTEIFSVNKLEKYDYRNENKNSTEMPPQK